MAWDRVPIGRTRVKRARRTAAAGVALPLATTLPARHCTAWSRFAPLTIGQETVRSCRMPLSA